MFNIDGAVSAARSLPSDSVVVDGADAGEPMGLLDCEDVAGPVNANWGAMGAVGKRDRGMCSRG